MNETRVPSDLFLQMRALIISDHQLETERVRREGWTRIPECTGLWSRYV